jgi:hypothetical protein
MRLSSGSSGSASIRQTHRHLESLNHRAGIGFILPNNIVGSAVGWCGVDRFKAARKRNALAKTEQLRGDLTLIVIHDHHGI